MLRYHAAKDAAVRIQRSWLVYQSQLRGYLVPDQVPARASGQERRVFETVAVSSESMQHCSSHQNAVSHKLSLPPSHFGTLST